MDKIHEIPDHPRKKHNVEPFDINAYLDDKYEKIVNDYKLKYNESHLKTKLIDLEKKRLNELNVFHSYLTMLITQVTRAVDKQYTNALVRIDLWGPSVPTLVEGPDIDLIPKAIEWFLYQLTLKGYPYSVSEKNEVVQDFLEGICNKRTKIIDVKLI